VKPDIVFFTLFSLTCGEEHVFLPSTEAWVYDQGTKNGHTEDSEPEMAGWFIVRGPDMNLFDPRCFGGFFLPGTKLIVVRDKQFKK
jgi:hypothetical protein